MNLGKLAGTTGLLLVTVTALARTADRLTVGNFRSAGHHLDLVPTGHPVLDHLQVQLAHPPHDHLLGLGFAIHTERRILILDFL